VESVCLYLDQASARDAAKCFENQMPFRVTPGDERKRDVSYFILAVYGDRERACVKSVCCFKQQRCSEPLDSSQIFASDFEAEQKGTERDLFNLDASHSPWFMQQPIYGRNRRRIFIDGLVEFQEQVSFGIAFFRTVIPVTSIQRRNEKGKLQ
jgi:hypothetical protein